MSDEYTFQQFVRDNRLRYALEDLAGAFGLTNDEQGQVQKFIEELKKKRVSDA